MTLENLAITKVGVTKKSSILDLQDFGYDQKFDIEESFWTPDKRMIAYKAAKFGDMARIFKKDLKSTDQLINNDPESDVCDIKYNVKSFFMNPYTEREGFLFASHGKRYRNTCGDGIGVKVVKKFEIETKTPITKGCSKLSCPECFMKASSSKAKKIEEHSRDYINFLIYSGIKYINPRHITFNKLFHPEDINTWEKYKEKLDEFKNEISSYGEGVIISHPLRFSDKTRKILNFSFHFHVIFWGKLPPSEEFYKKHKYTYVDLSNKTKEINGKLIKISRPIRDLDAIFRIARYAVSHSLLYQMEITRKHRKSNLMLKEYEAYLDKSHKSYLNDCFTLGLTPEEFPHQPRTYKEFRTKKSLQLRYAYTYFGFMIPQRMKILKEYKTRRKERCKEDISGAKGKFYRELINGYLILKKTRNCIRVYTPNQLKDNLTIISPKDKIIMFPELFEYGRVYTYYKYMKRIIPRNFKKFKEKQEFISSG